MSSPIKGPDRVVTHNAVKIQLAGTPQVHIRATEFTVADYSRFQGITTNNTMPSDAFLVLFSFAPMALVAGAVERQLAAILRLAVVTELVSTARGLQTKKARVTVRDINGQLRVPSVLQSFWALAVVKAPDEEVPDVDMTYVTRTSRARSKSCHSEPCTCLSVWSADNGAE